MRAAEPDVPRDSFPDAVALIGKIAYNRPTFA
jgi:hypothetical protein